MGCGASAGGEHYETMKRPDGVGGLYETRARPGESRGSPRPQRSQQSTAATLYLPGTVVCSSDDELLEAGFAERHQKFRAKEISLAEFLHPKYDSAT